MDDVMQATITIDDELYARAMSLAEPGTEASLLIATGLRLFIQRHYAQRLSELGGSMPQLEDDSCRRNDPKTE